VRQQGDRVKGKEGARRMAQMNSDAGRSGAWAERLPVGAAFPFLSARQVVAELAADLAGETAGT